MNMNCEVFKECQKILNAIFCNQIKSVQNYLRANINHQITGTGGIYTFRIHGEMYHKMSILLSNPGNPFSFAQFTFIILDHEINNRLSVIPNFDFNIFTELQQILHKINLYINIFHQAGQLLRNDPLLDLN
ncbi:hypothetical protein RhiirA5_441916 [Rhizophagus irregularis]|uniref:Uncharacterized protein n=1 Tax=Rhizophagus irregularis TaxID=588596 RepID=A0A2N0NF83_9GLOM|nr:hypothetical protein RhiirA5_441916 [Rhizophagus irregularis]